MRVGILQTYNSKGENCGVTIDLDSLDTDIQNKVKNHDKAIKASQDSHNREQNLRVASNKWMQRAFAAEKECMELRKRLSGKNNV